MVLLAQDIKRIQLGIRGCVQGVGFRPYVYQLAQQHQITGWICNSPEGVIIEAQGINLNQFYNELIARIPTHAKIDDIRKNEIPIQFSENQFLIKQSQNGASKTKVMPDIALCESCLNELFDPLSRFYLYPFISCTHCGPRYSILQKLPFDRENTSMKKFVLCHACQQDYENPADKRFHAQTLACAQCGPHYSTSIKTLADRISQGKIVAVKSVGGYQLICDAKNKETIQELRKRKKRKSKPFALMYLNFLAIQQDCFLNESEKNKLNHFQKPIVLLKKKNDLFGDIAPGLNQLGVMLPSAPLHYLLFYFLLNSPQGFYWLRKENNLTLVVTSANESGDAIIKEDECAMSHLKAISDEVIFYNRKIENAVDDSVIKKEVFIRRARGYAPEPIALARELPSVLAVGAQLKNTFCITRHNEAFVSPHIGDLDSVSSISFFHHTISQFLNYLNIKPECVIHDFHPNYYTTHFAQSLNLECISIQHHQAHLASVMAEHQLCSKTLGLALDGLGWGEQGELWGGELFLIDDNHFQHVSALSPISLPGGDSAAREPWRIAAGILIGLNKKINNPFSHKKEFENFKKMFFKKTHCPITNSAGRYFDAASALLGLCDISDYEGHAAMLLESKVTQPCVFEQGWIIEEKNLNLFPLFEALVECDAREGANIFHGTFAKALFCWISHYAKKFNVNSVVLGGGCFVNQTLTETLKSHCDENQISVYLPHYLPPNDGGISLGQAWSGGNSFIKG